MAAQVDPLGSDCDGPDQGIHELLALPRERDDNTMMIRIRVDIEQARRPSSFGEGLDHPSIAPF